MKKYMLIFLGINALLLTAARAQDMPRTVVGSAGDYYQNILVGNLHWTVGEIAVSRYENGLELGEGFHQVYYDLLVQTAEELPEEWAVSVYPNPTTDWLKVRFPETETLYLKLFDTQGRLLADWGAISGEATLDVDLYPEGVYLLQLQAEDGRQRTVKVLKVAR